MGGIKQRASVVKKRVKFGGTKKGRQGQGGVIFPGAEGAREPVVFYSSRYERKDEAGGNQSHWLMTSAERRERDGCDDVEEDAEGDSETHCRGCSSWSDEEAASVGICWDGSGLTCEKMSRRREEDAKATETLWWTWAGP